MVIDTTSDETVRAAVSDVAADWVEAERLRAALAEEMDEINGVGEAAARRALPPATDGGDE